MSNELTLAVSITGGPAGYGIYRRLDNPDCHIKSIAYKIGDNPISVSNPADLPAAIIAALTDPDVTKLAANADTACLLLAQHYHITGLHTWLPQWHDITTHCRYLGLGADINAAADALGITPDHYDDPICQYVSTIAAIATAIADQPLPDTLQQQWCDHVAINHRGIPIDTTLASTAAHIAADLRADQLAEAQRITGLANPRSRDKMLVWVQTFVSADTPDLRRRTLDDLVAAGLSDVDANRAIQLHSDLASTSNQRYDTYANCCCRDGRVHGMLTYWGAHTGRWTSHTAQLHNLPKPRMDTDLLAMARDLVADADIDNLQILFGNTSQILSRLVRTIVVASPGNHLIAADFCAIEARVLAWLAGEQWVLDACINDDGHIYEAAASRMYDVPADTIRKGDPLRTRGKIATLALGYQGGVNALIGMGALRDGLDAADLPDIVDRWRTANHHIVSFWTDMGEATLKCVITKKPRTARGIRFDLINITPTYTALAVTLPSGRHICYPNPSVQTGTYGPTICYCPIGSSDPKHLYGGRIVENITQAVARDILADAISRLNDYPIIVHVHDEIVAEVPDNDRVHTLPRMLDIMRQPPSWAADLPLDADGWTGGFYH